MINIDYKCAGAAAEKKVAFFKKEKGAYFISSLMAGIYVGLCMITILVMAGALDNFAGVKILQGFSFAAALSLVVFAGSELFTGNVFVMTAGIMHKTVKPLDGIKLCSYCYLGNLTGSMLIAALFLGTGYLQGPVLEAAHIAMYSKTEPAFIELLVRGILCNILVCAAVWCMFRLKSEVSKLVMIFWCIYVFVVCGFEHSIANMTLFSMEVMAGVDSGTFIKILINLLATTTGNIIGGIALSFAYWSIARKTV
jgi:nitrite transporter NirC